MSPLRPSPGCAAQRSAAVALGAALLLAAGCSGDATGPPGDGDGDDGDVTLQLQEVATGLGPLTYLTSPPGDDRIFVLEQPGTVRLLVDGEVREEPWLDISGAVESGGERGLLGLAFHPDFVQNGRFYLDFTVVGGAGGETGDTRVVEYTVDPTADQVDPGPGQADTLLAVEQPFSNHNGGMLAFGPDGMLHVALGDGGGAGDPGGNGQDSTTVLGSLARLDPDAGPPFVPSDNPFVGREGDDRIWAYGLRNPWRFAFDPPSGTLFVADVGQNEVEEVNAEPADAAGLDYGWNVMEGTSCFEPPSDCEEEGLTLPVLDYPNNGACSVTGGFVYRGTDVPELEGRYVFSDLCAGFLRSFRLEGGSAADVVEHDLEIDGEAADAIPGSVTSFGTDADGELHVLTGGGTIYRVAGTAG
jgi:glucose/arabinose dehydrogenase